MASISPVTKGLIVELLCLALCFACGYWGENGFYGAAAVLFPYFILSMGLHVDFIAILAAVMMFGLYPFYAMLVGKGIDAGGRKHKLYTIIAIHSLFAATATLIVLATFPY